MPREFVHAIAAAFLVIGLSACEEQGPAERAGERVDETVEETREAAEEGLEEAEEETEEWNDGGSS